MNNHEVANFRDALREKRRDLAALEYHSSTSPPTLQPRRSSGQGKRRPSAARWLPLQLAAAGQLGEAQLQAAILYRREWEAALRQAQPRGANRALADGIGAGTGGSRGGGASGSVGPAAVLALSAMERRIGPLGSACLAALCGEGCTVPAFLERATRAGLPMSRDRTLGILICALDTLAAAMAQSRASGRAR